MFDAVRNNKRIVQFFLVLITLPFALWGVEWYTRSGPGADDVATIAGMKIGQQEFQLALREQQDRLRGTLGKEFKPDMLNAPEVRRAVLESMINQRLLSLEAQQSRLSVSDEQLRQFIASVPAFQDKGQFSMERYEAVARNQGMSPAGFEARMRQDLAMQQAAAPFSEGAMVSRAVADRWLALQRETREIAEYLIKPEQFAGQIKLTPDAVQRYYEANRKRFEVPEQVQAEYLVLSQDTLADSVVVGDDDIKHWYDAHLDQYKQPEERRASHILIAVAKEATQEQKNAARAKIDDILKQVRQHPADFEKLAKGQSQDPGSAAKGGDLGFFGRGMMVKAFEDAAFALKENQISEVVPSDFGFHIIKLTGIKPEKLRTLDEVKEDIRAELKRQGAGRKFAEVADQFNNLVYEQSDSLKPAADKFGLTVRRSGWIVKGAQAPGELNNERLITALFSEDAIKNKRNTEAVEVGPNTLIAARVLEHKPAQVQTLDAVRAGVEKQLTLEEAAKLAQKDGADKLARLLKGENVTLAWSAPKSISRAASAPGMSAEGVRAAFKLAADKLPRYTGMKSADGGFALYKLEAVKPAQIKADDPRLGAMRGQLARLYAEEEFGAYIAALKERHPVKINTAALEAK